MRGGALALVAAGCCASAAIAATSHSAKHVTKPTGAESTAGLSAQVSLPGASAAQPSAAPDAAAGPIQTAGTNSSLGAGAERGAVVLASASDTFTLPTFSCASPSDKEWLLPGIWIFTSGGSVVSQVDVNFNCNSGVKLQQGVICINGGTCNQTLHPNPGDVIEAVYVQTGSTATGELIDRTQGTSAVATGPLATGTVVFEGDLGPSPFGVTQVPTFVSVPFSVATINGFYVADWGPTRFNLQTGSFVQITAGAVKTTSFKTTFVHN
jgi:hypothetical protein